jgi:hypothetical protein
VSVISAIMDPTTKIHLIALIISEIYLGIDLVYNYTDLTGIISEIILFFIGVISEY